MAKYLQVSNQASMLFVNGRYTFPFHHNLTPTALLFTHMHIDSRRSKPPMSASCLDRESATCAGKWPRAARGSTEQVANAKFIKPGEN